MKHFALAAALASFSIVAASAKTETPKDPPVMRPLPEGVAKPTAKGKSPAAGPAQARIVGCVTSTLWNTGGIDYYSHSFGVTDSSGAAQTFAFAPTILHASTPGSLMLATRADSEKWRMVIESVERAAAARRQVMVDYETVSRRTFGVMILWDTACP